MLASRRQTDQANVYRNPDASSGKRQAPALHTTGVPIHLVAPDARSMQILADWGVQKANMLAELPYDAGVTEGDELRIGSAVYQVERAVAHDTMTLAAVWWVRGAPTGGDTGNVLLDDSGNPLLDD